jgi:hypothetical protein
MKPSTAKRVVLYRFDRERLDGIVNPAAYLLESALELISASGILTAVPYAEVKAVCFVSDSGDPRLFSLNTAFERRPRTPGLWARLTFRDGDRLEVILSNNLLEWPAQGYLATPPFVSSLRQRVFIPRTALTGTELRGVIGAAGEKKVARKPPTGQLEIFGPLIGESTES